MTLTIRLLGTAEIKHRGTVLELKGNKPLALLAYLLVTGKAHTRQYLVDLLYDEADDPRRSLRWTLNQLRKSIGPEYIIADRDIIGFDFDSDYRLDIEALAAGELEQYRGEFLEGVYIRDAHRFMDWAFFQRERLRGLYQTALIGKLEAAQGAGQYELVVNLGHQLIRLDNLQEAWYRAVMQAYTLLGNRDAALAQYEVCRETLARELGVGPEPETTALVEHIKAGTLADPRRLADLPVQFPPFLQDSHAPHPSEATTFVAREQALDQLSQFLARVVAGQGQVVFVTGSAGRGKTTLLREFARQAQRAHGNLLMAKGNCDVYAGIGDPYLPFRDLVGMLTGDVATSLAAGRLTLDQARRLWAGLLPASQAILDHGRNLIDVLVSQKELLARVTAAAPRGVNDLEQLRLLAELSSETVGELAQENLFQQLTNVLQALAARQPLLLMLDDLQWADATSLSLLFHLGRRLTGSQIMIVGAYRPEEVAMGRGGERHPLEKILTEFKRVYGDIWIDLEQVGEPEDQRFIDAILDSEPNLLGPAFRKALYRHTGGHPLFTVELLRAMQERGNLVQNEQGQWLEGAQLNWEYLPARVEAVIEERIGRLEEELRQTLTVASVDGEQFTAQVVARIQAVSERRLLGQLSQELTRRHRLVRGQGEFQVGQHILSRYQFAHALFQRYFYNELSPEERRLLHAEVGATLEELYGEYAPEIAVQLAWHFSEARKPDKARQYFVEAGFQAARHYANDEAVSYLGRALELAPADDLAGRYELLLVRERVFALQGDRTGQEEDLTAAYRLAEVLDDNQKRAEVAIRWANYAEATSDYTAAITMAQTALHRAQAAADTRIEAESRLYWGQALWRQGDYQASQRQLEQALTLAQDLPLLKARSLRTLGRVFWHQGDYDQARNYFQQTLLICRQMTDRQGEGLALNNLGIISALQGDNTGAKRFFEQSLGVCRQIGDRHVEANALNNLGIVAGHQGDYVLAKQNYEQALHIKQEIEDWQGQAMVLDNLGDASKYLGNFAKAQSYFEESLRIREKITDRQGAANVLNNLGNVAGYQGDFGRARDYFERSLHERREIGDRQGQTESLAYLSLLFHQLGDNDLALAYGQQALVIAQELGDQHFLGYAWTHVGHARAGLGDLAGASEAYNRAVAIRRELGEENRAMEPLAGLARVAMEQGELSQAVAHIEVVLNHLAASAAAISLPEDVILAGPVERYQYGLAGTEEPFRIYLTCYRVLRQNQDSRASEILATAHRLLLEQAANITNETLRHSFLEAVTANWQLQQELAGQQ